MRRYEKCIGCGYCGSV
ncbi:4Fe-4S binding protein [Flavobacterium frigidarium]